MNNVTHIRECLKNSDFFAHSRGNPLQCLFKLFPIQARVSVFVCVCVYVCVFVSIVDNSFIVFVDFLRVRSLTPEMSESTHTVLLARKWGTHGNALKEGPTAGFQYTMKKTDGYRECVRIRDRKRDIV